MRPAEFRSQIPQLGSGEVYLDSAATSLKPEKVLETLDRFYRSQNANIHRSPHRLGQQATERYESVRELVKQAFHAHEYAVVFTRGATEALNIVIHGIARSRNGAVTTSAIDHHSSFVACQRHALAYGREFRVLDVEDGIATDRIDGSSIVSVPMVSNVTGDILDYEDVVRAARGSGSLVMLDASQAAPHMLLDADSIGADAYVLSAHKMLGPTGLGVLIAKRELLDAIEPLLYGGEMVDQVSSERTTLAPIPHRFEAGTMPIAQVIAFSAALSMYRDLDPSLVEEHRRSLTGALLEGARSRDLPVLSAYASLRDDRIPILSITGPLDPYDMAVLLDARSIATRSGHHCAEPFHRVRGVKGSLRASAHLYTSLEDIERFFEELDVILHA